MRFLEMAENLARQAAAGGAEMLSRDGGPSRALRPEEICPHWRPAPESDGSLTQDPEFSLPTTAGPIEWSLYHDSQTASQTGAYGYGRRGSFPLNLKSDGTTATVMHEDGTFARYRVRTGGAGCIPAEGTFDALQQNGDGSWDETLWAGGLVYHYPAGNSVSLAYRETPHGLRLSHNYDGSGRLWYVEEPAGRRVTLGYAAAGLTTVQYVQDWGDRRNTLSYNGAGDLIEEQGPTGCLTQYAYDAWHRLSSITDPEAFETTYSYDSSGRVLTRSIAGDLGQYTYLSDAGGFLTMTYKDPLGRIWTSSADPGGNPFRRIDPLGNRETYSYLHGRLFNRADALGRVASYAYDGNGFLRATRDPLGSRTTISRDRYGNIVSMIDAVGAITTTSYGASPEMRQPATVMNALGFISTMGYLDNGLLQFEEDPLGNRTTYNWSVFGLLDSLVNPLGYRVSSVYDLVGNRIGQVDPLGFRTTFGYDGLGRQVTRQLPLGKVATTQYDARGLVQAEIQMHYGYRTTYLYNARAQRTALIDPYGYRTSSLYNAAGELVAQQDALGNLTTYSYDLAGRLVELQNARGYRSTTVYDAAGQVSAQVGACGERTSFVYDNAGRQVAAQDALGYLHTTNYDSASRVRATTDPLGFVTTFFYDVAGQTIGSIDALARRTTAVYDGAGRSTARQDARGYLTSFVYDGASQQVASVNPNGGTWTTQYDARGMVEAHIDPLGARTTFVYNGDGLETLKRDARGNRITQNYEPRNLPLYTIYPDNAQVTVNYDQGPRMTGEWDVAGRRLLTYDRIGRLTELRNVTQGWRLTYGYDAVSNRSYLVAPDGRTTYQYDGDNRCVEVWNPYDERTTWVYDPLGRELRKTYANGMVASHSYDAAGRDVLLANRLADGTGIAIYSGTYDAVGNRVTNLELDGSLVTYSYNASYQLIREQRSGPYAYDRDYQYDGNGNRVLKTDSGAATTYQYNAADEILLVTPPSGQPTTSTWDADGNLRAENAGGQVTTYAWDPENRLTSVVSPDATSETYLYQANGLRQKRTAGGVTTLFLWDMQNLLLETDASVVAQARYTDWPGYWGGLASQRGGGSSSFGGFDLQGNNRVLVSSLGLLTDTRTFSAFGEEIAHAGSTANPLRYVGLLGYYADAAPRLYVRERYYAPADARWLTRDPVPSRNLYLYCLGNPVRLVDPSGLAGCSPIPQGATCLGWSVGACGFVMGPFSMKCWTTTGTQYCCSCVTLQGRGHKQVYKTKVKCFGCPGPPRPKLPVPSRKPLPAGTPVPVLEPVTEPGTPIPAPQPLPGGPPQIGDGSGPSINWGGVIVVVAIGGLLVITFLQPETGPITMPLIGKLGGAY